jgi:hypothetical protein
MVAIVIGGLALVALLTVLLTRDTGTADQTAAEPTSSPETVATQAPATPAATPTPTVALTDAGEPYSGAEIVYALTTRGMLVAPADQVPCANAAVPARTYRITRADGSPGEQIVAVMTYPNAQALQAQWSTGSSGAQYRTGGCGVGATVIYFNANAILMMFQVSDQTLRRQVSDAFLAAAS